MRAVIFAIAGAWIGLAQTPGQQGPPPGAASVRASGGSLGRIRVGGADSKIWFGWPVTIRANVFQQLTLSEAAAKADALGLASIEGVSTQKLSAEIPKNLDFNLKPGERKAVLARFRELNLKMPVYLVPSIAGDADSKWTKLARFAIENATGEPFLEFPKGCNVAERQILANFTFLQVVRLHEAD